MPHKIYNRIKILIDETNEAFQAYGHGNADFAHFAQLAISDFRNILQDPQLSSVKLEELIRNASSQHRKTDNETSWSSFMARYIAETANANDVSAEKLN